MGATCAARSSSSAGARSCASRTRPSRARATAPSSRGSRRARSGGRPASASPPRRRRPAATARRASTPRRTRRRWRRSTCARADRHKERAVRRRNSPHSERVEMPVKKSRVLIAPLAAAAAALALPAGASAEIVEVGAVPPASPPSCPARPCLAVSRTTGYQAKVGTARAPMTIPKTGRIVAWSIALGNPGAQQTTFFNQRLGGESEAQITILNPRRKLRSRVMAVGEPQKLEPYFGSTPQFALQTSLRVRKGWVVALTVPTWAPALAVGLGADTSWRASRGRGDCNDTSAQTAQTRDNQLARYFCLYRTARLTYTATLIADPVKPAAAPAQ